MKSFARYSHFRRTFGQGYTQDWLALLVLNIALYCNVVCDVKSQLTGWPRLNGWSDLMPRQQSNYSGIVFCFTLCCIQSSFGRSKQRSVSNVLYNSYLRDINSVLSLSLSVLDFTIEYSKCVMCRWRNTNTSLEQPKFTFTLLLAYIKVL